MSKEDRAWMLSGAFVRMVKRHFILYAMKRPHIVLIANIGLLWYRMWGAPHRIGGWFPKNVMDAVPRSLNRATFSKLTTLARGMAHTGDSRYSLGKETLSENFRGVVLESFPFAAKIPDFFDRLYLEFIQISKEQSEHWWYLKEEANELFLLVSFERYRKQYTPPEIPKNFTKAISV